MDLLSIHYLPLDKPADSYVSPPINYCHSQLELQNLVIEMVYIDVERERTGDYCYIGGNKECLIRISRQEALHVSPGYYIATFDQNNAQRVFVAHVIIAKGIVNIMQEFQVQGGIFTFDYRERGIDIVRPISRIIWPHCNLFGGGSLRSLLPQTWRHDENRPCSVDREEENIFFCGQVLLYTRYVTNEWRDKICRSFCGEMIASDMSLKHHFSFPSVHHGKRLRQHVVFNQWLCIKCMDQNSAIFYQCYDLKSFDIDPTNENLQVNRMVIPESKYELLEPSEVETAITFHTSKKMD